MPTSIQVDDGKYEFVIEENGGVVVFRHGEAWVELTQATKAVIALIHEVIEAWEPPSTTEDGLSRVRLTAIRTSCEEEAAKAAEDNSSDDVIGWLNAAECAHEALKRLPKVQQ